MNIQGKTEMSEVRSKRDNERFGEIFEKAIADITSLTDDELTELILFYVQPEALGAGKEKSCEVIVPNGDIMYSAISRTKETETTVSFFNSVELIYDKIYDVGTDGVLWEDYDSAGTFFLNCIGKDASEVLCAVFIDQKGRFIKIEKFSVDRADFVSAGIEKIIRIAKGCKAHKVVIAHNHPSGCVGFSKEDWASTKMLLSVFETMNISLIEHYAVASDGYCGIFRRFNHNGLPFMGGSR